MDSSKRNLKPMKKMSAAYSDADFALQHAVVRGEPKEVLDVLRQKRDALDPKPPKISNGSFANLAS